MFGSGSLNQCRLLGGVLLYFPDELRKLGPGAIDPGCIEETDIALALVLVCL